MNKIDVPPIPKQMTSKSWRNFFIAGAVMSWGFLVYALYFV